MQGPGVDGAGPCWGCELCFKSSWELIHLSRDSTVWLSFERASALRCAEWMARGSGGGVAVWGSSGEATVVQSKVMTVEREESQQTQGIF